MENGITLEPEGLESPARPKRSRKRSILIFVVVSLLNVGLLALLWTQLLTPRANTSGNDSSSSLGDMPSALLGKAAPDFTLPVLNGNGAQIHLADLKGKAVIVNFWTSNCPPCNDEAPFMEQTWKQLKSRGVVMLGVDGAEPDNNAVAFLSKFGITYTNVKDGLDGQTAQSYGVTGNPETFFINTEGVVVARWVSPLTSRGLQQELAKLK